MICLDIFEYVAMNNRTCTKTASFEITCEKQACPRYFVVSVGLHTQLCVVECKECVHFLHSTTI